MIKQKLEFTFISSPSDIEKKEEHIVDK